MVDDYGYNDMSFRNDSFYETPNIDQLASESTVFTEGYANSRVCSPSRASIMTGKFTARHGITDWIGAAAGEAWRKKGRFNKLLPPEYIRELPSEDITLAEALKARGYTTFFAGKWHLGEKGSWPEDHGFDINIGGTGSGSPRGGYFSPFNNPNLDNNKDGENLSMRLANETVSFIKAHQAQPFFAFLSFYAVHGPIQTTEKKWSKYQAKAVKNGIAKVGFEMGHFLPIRQQQDNPVYAGLVESMDDAVGKVLTNLQALGLDKNTMVIFTSDNGGVVSGDNYATTNFPLRGGKGYQFEGGIKEPYFIKVPWLETQERTSDVPVTGADLYPTILDFTGLDLKPQQHQDGTSLKPLLIGEALKERPLIWHYPHYGNQGGEPSSIIRRGKWKLIHYHEDGRDALYNLKTDVGEATDVSEANEVVTAQLKQELFEYLESTGAEFPMSDALYDAELENAYLQKIATQKLRQLEEQRLQMLRPDFKPNADWWGSQTTKD
ncbi:sulfatase [Croceivirga lutea]|nr:sulfatase [Croceivirga lutea]